MQNIDNVVCECACKHDESKVNECKCSGKTKERSEKEYKNLVNRLSRIEGQVRGLKNMLDNDAYCIDILNQVSAIKAALNGFGKQILTNHVKTCVVEGLKREDEDIVDELIDTIQTMLK